MRHRVGQHGGPDLGQAHRSAGAVEQFVTELALEPSDLRAHAGLGDVQPASCSGEVRFLRHRDEVLEMVQLHNS